MRRTHRNLIAHARANGEEELLEVQSGDEAVAEVEVIELTEEQRLAKIGEAERLYMNTLRELGVKVDE